MKPEVFIGHSLNLPVFAPPPEILILPMPMNFTHSLATRKIFQAVILVFFQVQFNSKYYLLTNITTYEWLN